MRAVTAIERHIVRRLAEPTGRDPLELQQELRLADRDLPVEAEELRAILPVLEADFGVSLQEDARLVTCLSYARDFAVLVHKRMAASRGEMSREPRWRASELVVRRLGRAA